MSDHPPTPAKLLILVALFQGLFLLILHQSIELEFWPHSSPQWLFAFYSMAFVGPTMLLLSLQSSREILAIKWIAPFTLFTGVLGYYVGFQATPISHVRFDSILFVFILTMGIASFKALIYIQFFVSHGSFSYHDLRYSHLFLWSWRNFLTLALALLFAGCFWGVLMLWAGLFKAIKVDFFYDLFTEQWFFYPAIALANGFGVVMFRNLSHIIDTITRLQQALMKFLLVILVLVSILFLSALPFTGLDPLWESGGSTLILWMQALLLFFINAVYQDDPDARPYQLWLHRFIYFGVMFLPIYSAISFYGLSLRLDQHGWSLMRCWAFLIWFLLALFPIGYIWGILKLRDNWLQQLSRTNTVMGLLVLVVMLLVNSPLLDFRKVVVNNQISRLENKELDLDDFDVGYFRRHLARPGYLALQNLKEQYGESNPAFKLRITNLYLGKEIIQKATHKEEFLLSIETSLTDIPESLGEFMFESVTKNHWSLRNTKKFYLIARDANADDQMEYLFIKRQQTYSQFSLIHFENGKWREESLTETSSFRKYDDDFYDAMGSGNVEVAPPLWQDIIVGGHRFRVH